MKTVLITGSAGFIGSNTVEHFLEKTDWNIIGLDSFRHKGDSRRVHHLIGDRYKIVTHDLVAPLSERLIHHIGKVDYILNLASMSHVDTSITDPVPFVMNNMLIGQNMLEYARVVQPEIFIQCSTDEVFGAALAGYAHKEWEPSRPSNPYAASKQCQDSLAYSYWRTFGVPVVITHCMNLIGNYQDSEKFLPMLISKISRGQTVKIHGKEGDIGSRYYLHAKNLADAWLFLLKKGKPSKYQDIPWRIVDPDKYNIVGERELDNLQLAKIVAEFLGKELHFEFEDFHATRPGHDRRYALDGTKLTQLGWTPPVPLLDSIKETVEWTLANPEWML